MALVPRFQLHLPERVLSGRAALGRFDGSSTSIAYATAAGKVFLHNPHDNSAGQQPRLNINKQVTVLGAGPLLPNSLRDVLLVGTPTCLHCYDVKHNRDVFYKDIPDGVHCMAVGAYGSQHSMVAVVGGAGSLAAFTCSGAEALWQAVSGSVTALALADVDDDGINELLVGCDDAMIRIYKDGELLQQITEADAVVQLAGLGQGKKWAYALQNGTIGVYESGVRLWRVKSKHSATSLCAFDLGGGGSSGGSGSSAADPSTASGGGPGGGGSGLPHLISGWSSGRIEARSATSGEVIARDSLGAGIAGLLWGQVREADGAELELVAVSTDGELRGYLPHHGELVADAGGDVSMQQRLLIELAQKKQQLIYELSSYQQAGRGGSGGGAGAGGSSVGSGSNALTAAAGSNLGIAAGLGALGSNLSSLAAGGGAKLAGLAGAAALAVGSGVGAAAAASSSGGGGADLGNLSAMIPPDTCVDSAITVNRASQMCELVLKTNNSTVIHAALIFGEQVFDGESLLVSPQQPSSSLTVPLTPRRDTPVLLLMKVLVGSRASSVYHVFELDLEMPKFAAYAAEDRPPAGGIPASHVCFELQHPASRVASWLEARFGARAALAAATTGGSSGGGARRSGSGAGRDQQQQQQQLNAHFTCLRTKQQLAVRAAPSPQQGGCLMVWLHCESITLAGELLQDLASWLGVSELTSTASFPAAMAAFRDTLSKVEAASAARSMVEGDTAQVAAAIKAAVVRAEDARLLGDMPGLKRAHKRLADLNRDMWLAHGRRVANQQELLAGLRAVNSMIQAAAGLRVGPAQAKVVAACRAAIKSNNLQSLEKVVASGT